MYEQVENKRFELRHVKTEDNTSDINSKNTKIDIHKKLAERLYNGLAIAEMKKVTGKSDSKSSKEDVEYSYVISVDDVLPNTSPVSSYDYNYETEQETREVAQATNLANPVMIPVMNTASSGNKETGIDDGWAVVKGRRWKERQYRKESGELISGKLTGKEPIQRGLERLK
jgi:tRNA U38,U39,U40 pseudouridine synthase TruA